MNTSTIGSQTEAVVLAELVKRGKTVFVPFGGHHRCDYIIDDDGRLIRVQCKTGRLRGGVIIWDTASRDKNWADRSSSSRSYDGDVDVFYIYCPEVDTVYCVPLDVVARGKARLRLTPARNGQSKGILWAKDFEI